MNFKHKLLIAALGFTCLGQAMAAVSPEEAAKLDSELTPFGAERAASADGVIPAWDGGLTTPPSTWDGGGKRPDPWADDTVYLTITKDNMAQYAEQQSDEVKDFDSRIR